MKVGILLAGGLDNAGSDTLFQEMSSYLKQNHELTSCVRRKSTFAYNTKLQREVEDDNIVWFNEYGDKNVIDILNQKEVTIIYTSPMTKQFPEDAEAFVEMVEHITSPKIVLCLDRGKIGMKYSIMDERVLKSADLVNIFTEFNNIMAKTIQDSTYKISQLDINFFNWNNSKIPYAQKRDEIAYVGRFANFKGYNKIISLFQEGRLPKSYLYTIQGGKYTYNKETNNLAGSPGELVVMTNKFDKTAENKGVIDCLKIHTDYEEYNSDLNKDQIHVFPEYKREDMYNRLAKSKYFLLLYRWKEGIQRGIFRKGFEYCFLESINLGTPIITSKNFGREMICSDGLPLIEHDCGLIFIDDDTDIELAIKEYEKNYDENVTKMQEFFKNIHNNDIIFNSLISELNKYKNNIMEGETQNDNN